MAYPNFRSAFLCALFFIIMGARALPNLRIMPLGDSITKGSLSTDGNGYRKDLRDALLANETRDGFTVDMIGSLQFGDMLDNDHEGHSGKYLSDIQKGLENSIEAQPNVILLMGGTNNMDKEVDLGTAPELMESIVDRLFEAAPNTTVLLAPVIWANDTRMQRNTNSFNKQIKSMIQQKQDDGKHIMAVTINITISDLADKKHPNDEGYAKMARAWFNAILEANDREWLKSPAKVNADDLPGTGLGYEGYEGGDEGDDGDGDGDDDDDENGDDDDDDNKSDDDDKSADDDEEDGVPRLTPPGILVRWTFIAALAASIYYCI